MPLAQSLSISLSHTHTHTQFISLSHTHTHTVSVSVSLTHTEWEGYDEARKHLPEHLELGGGLDRILRQHVPANTLCESLLRVLWRVASAVRTTTGGMRMLIDAYSHWDAGCRIEGVGCRVWGWGVGVED